MVSETMDEGGVYGDLQMLLISPGERLAPAFIGQGPLGLGQVRVEDVWGPDVLIQVDLDANKSTVEAQIRLSDTATSIIKADDFIL